MLVEGLSPAIRVTCGYWEDHMGIFDKILGVGIGVGALAALNNYFEKQGGLQNVVSQFQKNGFGDTMKSWISQGQNLPITADQVHQAIGPDQLKELATTPDGKLPS
jgi:uncharacterized protein YidB (DUF937 family)